LQAHAARQETVMVDEGLHGFEETGAQAGLVGTAGRRGDEVDVTFAFAAAFLVPRERPRGAFAFGKDVTVPRLAEVGLAFEDGGDRLQTLRDLLEVAGEAP